MSPGIFVLDFVRTVLGELGPTVQVPICPEPTQHHSDHLCQMSGLIFPGRGSLFLCGAGRASLNSVGSLSTTNACSNVPKSRELDIID